MTDEELARLCRNPLAVAYAYGSACGHDHPLYAEMREYLRRRAEERGAVYEAEAILAES